MAVKEYVAVSWLAYNVGYNIVQCIIYTAWRNDSGGRGAGLCALEVKGCNMYR